MSPAILLFIETVTSYSKIQRTAGKNTKMSSKNDCKFCESIYIYIAMIWCIAIALAGAKNF